MTKEERNALLYKPQNGLDRISAVEEAEMNDYCEQYKAFLDVSKTERECVVSAIRLAEAKGFKPYTPGMGYCPRRQALLQQPRQGHHAHDHRPEAALRGREHRCGPHRLAAARPQAQSAL